MASNQSNNNPLVGVDYTSTIFSPRWFMENLLYIVDKNNKLVKFKLNEEQSIMLEHVEFCLENDLPIRMIVLKARQIGSTTFFTALGFWFASMNRNITYGIVAHLMKSSESIFQKCKVFYNNLPKGMQPATTQMSGEGITFDRKNGTGINSKIQFATVSEGVFRGQTLSYLHLSECAFWDGNVQAVENSLSPTVSVNPRTIVVRESTANGYNTFKDDWDRAVKGKSEYTPFFFGWHQHSEYKMRVPMDFTLSEKEALLKDKFKLSDEQIMWRRYKINNDYQGNDLYFQQEYPMTPEESFVASGSGVFGAELLQEGFRNVKDPIEKHEIKSVPVFEKLLIWEKPEVKTVQNYAKKSQWSVEKQEFEYVDSEVLLDETTYMTPYTLAIDTSGMGGDLNQIVVINNITKRLVARWGKEKIGEEYLASIAVEIAKIYHNAMIAPEVNYSHEICNYIIKLGYTNLYITETTTRQDVRVVGGIEYGWRTTTSTKPPMISFLRSLLNEDASRIPDREFWEEAEYYILQDPVKNIMNSASGHHDDIIVACAIGAYVSNSFQAKQTRTVVTDKKSEPLFPLFGQQPKGKTKLRKGIYKNYA